VLLIQIILIVAVVLVSYRVLRGQGARHQAFRRLMLVVFAVFGVLSILFPGTWTRLATLVGVGRGADLLLYALLVAFLGYVATSYLRFRELENRFTRLARRIALDEVPPPPRSGQEGPALPGGRPGGPAGA
jgi:small membrane protein